MCPLPGACLGPGRQEEEERGGTNPPGSDMEILQSSGLPFIPVSEISAYILNTYSNDKNKGLLNCKILKLEA